jgi:DNA-binding transcriptional MocR family regulator
MDAPINDPSNYENYWTPIWNHALKLKDSPLRVLIALGTFADFKDGKCWPATASIAARAQCSMSTVRRAIKVLITEGFIEVEHRSRCHGDNPTPNRSNKYWLLSPAYSHQGVNADRGGVAPATVPPVSGDSHNDNQGRNPKYLHPPLTVKAFSSNQSWEEELGESNRRHELKGGSLVSLDKALDDMLAQASLAKRTQLGEGG